MTFSSEEDEPPAKPLKKSAPAKSNEMSFSSDEELSGLPQKQPPQATKSAIDNGAAKLQPSIEQLKEIEDRMLAERRQQELASISGSKTTRRKSRRAETAEQLVFSDGEVVMHDGEAPAAPSGKDKLGCAINFSSSEDEEDHDNARAAVWGYTSKRPKPSKDGAGGALRFSDEGDLTPPEAATDDAILFGADEDEEFQFSDQDDGFGCSGDREAALHAFSSTDEEGENMKFVNVEEKKAAYYAMRLQ